MSGNISGSYWLEKVATPLEGWVFTTLPNNSTELLNCLCSGPTSDKSLGTLFILSFNKTTWDVLPSSLVGKGVPLVGSG